MRFVKSTFEKNSLVRKSKSFSLRSIFLLFNSPLTKIQEVDLKGYKGKNYSILCNHKFGSSFDFSPSTIEGFYDCGYKTIMDEVTEKSRREFNSSSDSESSDNESIYEVSFDIDT